jgi:hypothetical protein
MFDWSSLNAPGFYTRSLLGKLFGRYGTYSAAYRANIWRGLANGTSVDRLAFVGRFVANNLAIKKILGLLGIAATDFIPGAPALFGGGPDFNLAVALLQSGGSGYEGQQARSEALRMLSPVIPKREGGQITGAKGNFPSLLPGSMQYRFAKKGVEALDREDYYNALLAFTMTPTVKVSE